MTTLLNLMDSVILGIDPALASIGYGAIRGNKALDYGVITTPANTPIYFRLSQIYQDVTDLCEMIQPQVVAIEIPFFGREIVSAGKVQKALGVIELALGDFGLSNPIYLHQSQVKSYTAQYGAAKQEMKYAVKAIFNLPKLPSPDDSADGLAIAYAAQCGASAAVA